MRPSKKGPIRDCSPASINYRGLASALRSALHLEGFMSLSEKEEAIGIYPFCSSLLLFSLPHSVPSAGIVPVNKSGRGDLIRKV